jgi:hypothetical protein
LKLNSLRLFLVAHRLSRFVLRFDATTVVVQALLPGRKLQTVRIAVEVDKFVARVKVFSGRWLRQVRVAGVVELDKILSRHAQLVAARVV